MEIASKRLANLVVQALYFLLYLAMSTVGNFVFYEALRLMVVWGQDQRIIIKIYNFVLLDWSFSSFLMYIVVVSLITAPIGYIGSLFFNYSYVSESLAHESNMWFAQVIVWTSAPLAFVLLNWVHGKEFLNLRIVIALLLFVAARVVLSYK